MRNVTKLAVGAVLACGAAIATAGPAAAQVSFGIGIGAPAYPVYPAYSCYDAYGNYLYSYPYCTAYAAPVYPAPVYAPPVVEPYFGIGLGFGGGWGYGHRDFYRGGYEHRGFERGYAGGYGGRMAMGGFHHR